MADNDLGASVEIDGLLETRHLLKTLRPDMLRELNRRVSGVQRRLKSGAQAKFSVTGHNADYRVFSRTRSDGFARGVHLGPGQVARGERWSTNANVLANVFEFAANVRDAKPQNVARTQSMLATISARFGEPGRFLWSAWDDIRAESMEDIRTGVKSVEDGLSKELGN